MPGNVATCASTKLFEHNELGFKENMDLTDRPNMGNIQDVLYANLLIYMHAIGKFPYKNIFTHRIFGIMNCMNYLGYEDVISGYRKYIVDVLTKKGDRVISIEEAVEIFGPPYDLTPEQEEEIRRRYPEKFE
jgi:hypothetical protein